LDTSNLLTPVSRTAPALRGGAFETAQLGGLVGVGTLGTVTTWEAIVVTVDSVVELVEDLFVVLFVDVVDLVLDVSEAVLVEEKDVERVVLEEDLVILELEEVKNFCAFVKVAKGKRKGSGIGMH
jgi:hypothetical protein